ncbi:hypothetical protein OYB49_24430, partial [Escherichia coli]|nr:hypothetical protein [Escherichia coli]
MGVWGSPQTVSGCAQGAAGNRGSAVVLEIGKQKHARGFEVGKRAMQDRQSTRNCMQCSVDCPPAAGSLKYFTFNQYEIYIF